MDHESELWGHSLILQYTGVAQVRGQRGTGLYQFGDNAD